MFMKCPEALGATIDFVQKKDFSKKKILVI
jgi:hypothetical protein